MYSLSIIGSILLNPKVLGSVIEHIRPAMLDNANAKKTLQAMIMMDIAGDPIDLVTVATKLRPEVDAIWLTTCMEAEGTALNISYYSRMQYEYWAKRELQTMCGNLTFDGTLNETLGSLSGILADFEQNYTEKKRPGAEAGVIVNDYLRHIENIKTGKIKTLKCTMPGLADDFFPERSIVPFYFGGLYIVISSYSSVGKSAFLANMAAREAEAGANIVIFSNEMGRFGYADRFAAYYSGIPFGHIMQNLITEHQRPQIEEGLIRFSQQPIRVYDKVRGIKDIRQTLKKLSYSQKIDFVLVDYIQNMVNKNAEVKQQLDGASKGLMEIAQEMDLTMVVASQIDNASAKGQNANANFMAPKGSGDIAADADIFIELNRDALASDEKKKHTIERIVKKNRPFGRVGRKDIYFNKSFSRIENEYTE